VRWAELAADDGPGLSVLCPPERWSPRDRAHPSQRPDAEQWWTTPDPRDPKARSPTGYRDLQHLHNQGQVQGHQSPRRDRGKRTCRSSEASATTMAARRAATTLRRSAYTPSVRPRATTINRRPGTRHRLEATYRRFRTRTVEDDAAPGKSIRMCAAKPRLRISQHRRRRGHSPYVGSFTSFHEAGCRFRMTGHVSCGILLTVENKGAIQAPEECHVMRCAARTGRFNST
jgi:hypothetical protein